MAGLTSKIKEILIDAVFINNGGGRILLNYLFETLEKTSVYTVTLLADKRLEHEYAEKTTHIKIIFIQGLHARNLFYKRHQHYFSSILCFANLPPNVKCHGTVFTYFHQRIYLQIPQEFIWVDRLKFKLKIMVLRRYRKNTNFWIVQSNHIKKGLEDHFKIPSEKILKIPFYPPFQDKTTYKRQKNSYLYISTGEPHKNHLRLIAAFCQFYDEFNVGKLTLTVGPEYSQLYEHIKRKQSQGYPIINVGFIDREELSSYYKSSEFFIFPSMAESYGLGIVESIENGCKVLGADLPYMHEICTPSVTFNPQSVESIYSAFRTSNLKNTLPVSQAKTGNEIERLVNILIQPNENTK